MRLAALVLLLAQIAVAQVPAEHVSKMHRFGDWFLRHEERIIQTSIVLGRSADAATTTHALNAGAVEGNGILGKHPSTAAVWVFDEGIAAGVVFCIHEIYSWKDPHTGEVLDSSRNWGELIGIVSGLFAGFQSAANLQAIGACTTNPAIVPGTPCHVMPGEKTK